MNDLIERFRSDPESVEEWRAVLALPITQRVLSLVSEKGPKFARAERLSWSPVDVSVAFGDEQGFRQYRESLEVMAEMWPKKLTEPEPDYKSENEE